MRYAIDVVYLDGQLEVLALEQLAPWRLGARVVGARSVVELAAGEAAALGLKVGTRLNLIERSLRATKISL